MIVWLNAWYYRDYQSGYFTHKFIILSNKINLKEKILKILSYTHFIGCWKINSLVHQKILALTH